MIIGKYQYHLENHLDIVKFALETQGESAR